MKKIFSMYKFMMSGMLSFEHFKVSLKKDTKKTLGKIVLYVVLVIALAPSYGLYTMFIKYLIDVYASLNQMYAVMALLFVGVSLVILFFGLAYVFSAFFSSKDINLFLSLPVKGSQIGAAKMCYLVTSEYLLVFLMMIPPVVIMGSYMSANALYYIYSFIVLLAAPIIPISIATIAEIAIIRAFGMKLSPEKVQSAFQLIFFAIILIIEFAAQSSAGNASGSQSEMIAEFVSNNMYLFDTAVAIYFPAKWAGMAFIGYKTLSGFLNLVIFAALSCAMFALGVFTVEKLYLKAVTNQPINTVSGVKKRKVDFTKEAEVKKELPKYMYIFLYDLKTILRTQIFWFNTIAIPILMPVIMAASMAAVSQGEFQGLGNELYSLKISFPFLYTTIGILGIGCASASLAGMSNVTASTFSREGKAFWMNQVLPISAKDQLIGRSLVVILTTILVSVILGVIGCVFAHMSLISLIPQIILSIILVSPNILIGIVIDANHPLLNWDNPVKAVKQNGNIILTMLLSMIFIAIDIVLLFVLPLMLQLNVILCALAAILINFAAVFIMASWFLKSIPYKFMG